jgi:hypothetical protein
MSDMTTAYNLAAAAVRQRFAEQHPEDLKVLEGIGRGGVAAISGCFDSVQEVLKRLKVPVTMDPANGNLDGPIAFVNCSSSYKDPLVKRLRGYVEEGGWLVSSDWALGHVIQKAFPNTVKWTGRATGDEVVSVEPGLDSLWNEVVVLGADPQWWLEGSSHAIEILDPEKVRAEAASHDLLVRYDAPVVAVSFAWGRGHVFHVISHFWHKRSRTPAQRYRGPGVDFLRQGMRLSEDGVAKVLREAKVQPDTVNFAALQSAATATELVAQLCVRASQAVLVSN